MIKVTWSSNDGDGTPISCQVQTGTTVGEFVRGRLGDDLDKYTIRVNRRPMIEDEVLQEEDKISAAPTKIQGAN